MIEKYKPLFIHLNPASIPEVVAHMQKYLIEHEFVTVDEFGTQFQEYIDAHPDIIKVGSVNGLTGDVVLTSENITMTGGTSDSIGTVIGDILEEASATGETVDDLVVDMDAVKSDIVTLENVFTGATEESSGVKGLVPAPANTQTSHYLKATGDFEAIPAREVVSTAVSGAGTVEEALTALQERIVATQPASISSKITLTLMRIVYYPALKLACLQVEINNVTTELPKYEVLLTWPNDIPTSEVLTMAYGSDVNGQSYPLGVRNNTREIINFTPIPVGTRYIRSYILFTTN